MGLEVSFGVSLRETLVSSCVMRIGSRAMTVNAPAASSSVQSVGVAFAVLEALADAGQAVGTSELARRLGQTKARVHRHLLTLRELGFVEKDTESDRYRLGWKSYRLGAAVTENFELRRMAHRHLLRLHSDSGQTVALAMPAGADVTVIDEIQAPGAVAITIRPGSVIPAATAALGRVILAFSSAEHLGAVLERSTAPKPKQLDKLLAAVRERWYELAVSERLPGIAALAAPVFDARNAVVASVGIIGSEAQVTLPAQAGLVAQVQQAAADISADLRSTAWRDAGLPAARARRPR
jgi:DNA-binding IclR family transcriptional regulator